MKKELQPKDEFMHKRMARQKRLRKRRAAAALITVIILLLIAGAVLSLTVFFPIETIKVSGSSRYTSEEIAAASGIDIGDNLFTASEKKTEEILSKSLPYIESVSFKRSLPGTLEITVKDADEYACYNVSGQYYSVSRSGRVLNKYDTVPEGLCEIRAEGVECKVGEAVSFSGENTEKLIQKLFGNFKACGLSADWIDITDEYSISFKTEGRFTVELGTENFMDKKFLHLKGMIENIDSSKLGNIDLSMWTSSNTEGTFVEEKAE